MQSIEIVGQMNQIIEKGNYKLLQNLEKNMGGNIEKEDKNYIRKILNFIERREDNGQQI